MTVSPPSPAFSSLCLVEPHRPHAEPLKIVLAKRRQHNAPVPASASASRSTKPKSNKPKASRKRPVKVEDAAQRVPEVKVESSEPGFEQPASSACGTCVVLDCMLIRAPQLRNRSRRDGLRGRRPLLFPRLRSQSRWRRRRRRVQTCTRPLRARSALLGVRARTRERIVPGVYSSPWKHR